MSQIQLENNIYKDKHQILQKLWEMKLPLEIELKNQINELKNSQQDDQFQSEIKPLYIFFNFIHYPMIYFDEITSFFQQYHPFKAQNIQLKYKNIEIPSTMPFGIFYNLYIEQDLKDLETNGPVKIELFYLSDKENDEKFQNLVNKQTNIDLNSRKYSENLRKSLKLWKYNLKQFLQNRYQAKGLNNFFLNQNDQTFFSMFDQSLNQNYQQDFYEQMYRYFIYPLEKKILDEEHQRWPLRVYFQGEEGRCEFCPNYRKFELLGNWIQETFPEIIEKFDNNDQKFILSEKYKNMKIFTRGIQIKLETPVLYLMNYLYYLDGFTYLCFKFY
ncbi:hypothetical protein PPERSA_02171 [Pseudocohnilembus persalinus]|uniref:Autophagy protein 5 n=1 Tax=Pseudocohnilembus persalinus TaxID=266149 RepID=A0A0V0QFT2_PSEPJ|nr:hypothetical protein PPERSA_02171 [Pseudocohnilembus persalinus]|eukprot:KRX01075.1 hypothetical protein PPERSA_02171 [Pseudocohnilembus persalinus]